MMKHTVSVSLLLTILNVSCSKNDDEGPTAAQPEYPAASLDAKPADRAGKAASLVEGIQKKLDIVPRAALKAPVTLASQFDFFNATLAATVPFTTPGDFDCKDILPTFDGFFAKLQGNFVQPIQNVIKETDKTQLQQAVVTFWNDTNNTDAVSDDPAPTETPADPFSDLNVFVVSAQLSTERLPVKVVFTPKEDVGMYFVPTATFEAGNDATGLYAKSGFALLTASDINVKVNLNFKANLLDGVIRNDFTFERKTKVAGETVTQDLAATFEVGDGDVPYVREDSTNADGTVSRTIEKTKEKQLTVTTVVSKEGAKDATFIGTIDIAADNTCKFKVEAAKE